MCFQIPWCAHLKVGKEYPQLLPSLDQISIEVFSHFRRYYSLGKFGNNPVVSIIWRILNFDTRRKSLRSQSEYPVNQNRY